MVLYRPPTTAVPSSVSTFCICTTAVMTMLVFINLLILFYRSSQQTPQQSGAAGRISMSMTFCAFAKRKRFI